MNLSAMRYRTCRSGTPVRAVSSRIFILPFRHTICRKCGKGPIHPQWLPNHVIKGAQSGSSTGGLRASLFRQGAEYSPRRLYPQARENAEASPRGANPIGPGFPARHGWELEADLKTVAI